MNWRIIRIIFRKELIDTLRDRRTVLATIGVPLLIYPIIVIFFSQIAFSQREAMESRAARVAIDPALPQISAWIADDEDIEIADVEDGLNALAEGDIAAYIRLEEGDGETIDTGGRVRLVVDFDSTEPSSMIAANRVEKRLAKESDKILELRLEAIALDRAYIEPITSERKNVAPPKKTGGRLLGGILPLIMVMMLGIGAFYPAVDITAGEKERGTFETLLSTPVRKIELVWGKFFAVFVLSLITGLLNLGSIFGTFALQLSQLSDRLGNIEITINAYTMVIVFVAMIPLAFFISASMMAIAVIARNFKEAQNFVTPFFVALIFPASMAVFPGTHLEPVYYLAPIANVVLLFKEALIAPVPIDAIFAVIGSTVAYAVAALYFAAWLFQREEILLAEEGGLPIRLRRSAIEPREVPTPGLGLALVAMVALLLFYAGSYLQARDIVGGLAISQWFLILAPVLFVLWYARIDLRKALNLHWPGIAPLIGAAILALGWIVVIIHISAMHQRILPMPEELANEMERMLTAGVEGWGLFGVILVFAVSPAICEEALFRGALLSSFRNRMPAWASIVLIGVLFGLIHMSIYRFLPLALSGIVITYAAWRTRSIYAGAVMHFTNNGMSVVISQPETAESLKGWIDLSTVEKEGVPPAWLVLGVLLAIVGVAIVHVTSRRDESSGNSLQSRR